MITPQKGDRVYIDDSFPNVSVIATDSLGFDWEDDNDNSPSAGSGGWNPFVDSEGKTRWRILSDGTTQEKI